MVQETTQEFSFRLTQAVEASPLAPPTPHGRLSWLQRELERGGTKVSVNTVHKWCHGLSRPREDKIRALAKTLKVDEVWLALGRKPVDAHRQSDANMSKAKGAVLLLAGLIEVHGGKVTFPANSESTPHLWANINGEQFGVIAVTPQGQDGAKVSFIVPEPVGPHRVLAVVNTGKSLSATLFDLTDVPRQSLGGFSVVTLETRKGNKFKVEGQHGLLSPMASVSDFTA